MRKLCFLLAALLLLCGCGQNAPVATCPPHIDSNNDGLCDTCRSSMLVSFDIYAINDLHGRLADSAYQPGVDELSTYLKQAQMAGNTILLSTGDMWQGTSESSLTGGLIMTDWMNAMDFTAMTLGGHEYDWGEDGIRKNRQAADFPFLGINVYSRETNQQVDYCESSLMVEFDGAQIGIIGAIGNCYNSIASENVRDVYFKTGSELTALVKNEAQMLRSQGADFIIYTIHDGSDKTTANTNPMAVSATELEGYYDMSLSEGYVDLVLEADTHYWYVLQDSHGVYHLQAGGNNKGLSHARVLLNKANGKHQVLTAALVPNSEYMHLADDALVQQLLEKYAQQIAPATKVLGINGQYRSGSAVCQLVAQLYCEKGMEKWGAEYDIVLGGGYISCRSPGYMDAGQIRYDQLQALLPFDNQITLCSIKGRDLISKFLETDHKSYFIKTTAYGERIHNSIDPDATYYVITDTYSANYAPNNMTIIATYAQDLYARDLLADYIRTGGLE